MIGRPDETEDDEDGEYEERGPPMVDGPEPGCGCRVASDGAGGGEREE